MREDKYQALGRQEAERWVMDRERPGREAVTQGKVALDVLQTMARQVEERLQTSVACPKGADWLLDNLYLLRQVQQGVTQAFRAQKSLPALCAPKQCLRVQQLAECCGMWTPWKRQRYWPISRGFNLCVSCGKKN